jgi:UDP-N-acetylglucosamine transferase subunit ALG13
MIFVTCGSSHFQFERMMRALDALPGDDLHVQHGPAVPPLCAEAYPYLPFDDIVDKIKAADVVISHAGVGSILCAIRAGHTPIIFPRLKRYHETVDDHQAELAEALAERGTAIVAWTPEDIPAAVAAVPPRSNGTLLRPDSLVGAVRTSIIFGRTAELGSHELPLAGVR